MPLRQSLFSALLVIAFAALVIGCDSSDGGAGYGSRDSTETTPTATATTPHAPPGAAVRTCGATGAGIEELRITGVGCDVGRRVAAAWNDTPSCAAPPGASRFSCSIPDGYRCLGTSAARGIAVSCTHPGTSISFVVTPD